MAELELTRILAADHAEQNVLGNLLELYIHDLSESFPFVQLGSDGRFGYPGLESYWTESAKRFAFLIKEAGKVAGFALVTVGSPAAQEPDVYDLAEFFVLRGHRRSGLGRRAALRLWQQLPAEWIVRCSESNPSALAFWNKVVAEFTHGTAQTSSWAGKTSQFRVFRFTSPEAR
jgi:predicted acetyltransferase